MRAPAWPGARLTAGLFRYYAMKYGMMGVSLMVVVWLGVFALLVA